MNEENNKNKNNKNFFHSIGISKIRTTDLKDLVFIQKQSKKGYSVLKGGQE